jgi:hypothetical protein
MNYDCCQGKPIGWAVYDIKKALHILRAWPVTPMNPPRSQDMSMLGILETKDKMK